MVWDYFVGWGYNGLLCAIIAPKTTIMNDIDFIRIASMLVLPKCIDKSVNPILLAVDYAEELLKECQKRENSENL